MEKVIATWWVKCNIECPHCEKYIDLMGILDEWYDILPEMGANEMDLNIHIECPGCKKELIVDETQF